MRNILLWVIAGFLIFAGCSGGGNPTAPGGRSIPQSTSNSIDNLPVIGLATGDDGSFNALGLFGAYEMKIDPVNASAELVSKRLPSLGESWIVNGINFFTVAPCSSCLYMKSVGLTADGYLELTFGIRHPFNPGDPLKPPTAMNRLDLDVFDLALIIRPIEATPKHYALIGADAYTGILANNAGYTVELKNVLSDPAAMPYALIVDDSLGATSTFNKFAMGTDQTFIVDFDLSGLTTLSFDMYLTMGYGASAKKATRLTPTYFNPEFNRKSAWKVEVIPPEGTNPPAMGNTWDDNNTTTPYPVTVKVWDWQHGVTTIANPPVITGDIAFASDVASVSVEVPGMNATLPSSSTPTSGTGTPANPLIYTVSFPNQNHLADGEYLGLVKVTDSRAPGSLPPTGTIDYLIDAKVGGALDPIAIPEFATYQTFVATVVIGNLPPTCDLVLSNYNAGAGEIITANPGTSADPDGSIASYEYDTNYNGTTFTPDITQIFGSPDFGDPVNVPLPCNTTGIPQTMKVALRVCDNGGPPAQCTICSKDVTIGVKMGNPGDLVVVRVNRGESGANARLITSIDLDWGDNICAVEYSIERNANGWNSGTNPPNVWTPYATSTASSYKYVLSGVDWDEDYRFRVIARAVAGGNPLSDSDPSQEAFVLFMSAMGSTATPTNTWSATAETSSVSNDVYFSTSSGGGPTVDSYGSTAWGPFSFGTPNINQWAILRTTQTVPDLAGQTTAWCEFYYNYVWSTWTSTTLGLAIGTISAVPSAASPTCDDFNPSNSIYGSGYPYNLLNCEGLNNEFGETNQAGWRFNSSTVRYCAYYLNDLIDGSGTRDWVAFGLANGSMDSGTNTVWGCFDAMAVVVY